MEKNGWRTAVDFFHAVARRFHEERGLQASGSLAYTTLLALVPLLTAALAVATAFPAFDDALAALQLFILENVLPDAPGVSAIPELFSSFSRNAGRLTAIGLAAFLVTGVMLMLTIDNALNRIFRVERRRALPQRVLTYWAVLTLGPVLIAGATITAMLPGYSFAGTERRRPPGIEFAEALGALSVLARAHQDGRVVSLKRIYCHLRILPYRCERVLERAARLGWAARTARDGWVLSRDPETLRVADVFRAFVYDAEAIGIPESEFGLTIREFSQKERKA